MDPVGEVAGEKRVCGKKCVSQQVLRNHFTFEKKRNRKANNTLAVDMKRIKAVNIASSQSSQKLNSICHVKPAHISSPRVHPSYKRHITRSSQCNVNGEISVHTICAFWTCLVASNTSDCEGYLTGPFHKCRVNPPCCSFSYSLPLPSYRGDVNVDV